MPPSHIFWSDFPECNPWCLRFAHVSTHRPFCSKGASNTCRTPKASSMLPEVHNSPLEEQLKGLPEQGSGMSRSLLLNAHCWAQGLLVEWGPLVHLGIGGRRGGGGDLVLVCAHKAVAKYENKCRVKCFLKGWFCCCFLSRPVLFTAEIRGLCWETPWKNSRDESCISWLRSRYQIIKNHFVDRAIQPENLLQELTLWYPLFEKSGLECSLSSLGSMPRNTEWWKQCVCQIGGSGPFTSFGHVT